MVAHDSSGGNADTELRSKTQTHEDAVPSDESDYERLKRLVMLHYSDGQELNHEVGRDASKTPTTSDVENFLLARASTRTSTASTIGNE
jgi:hypothetical protein